MESFDTQTWIILGIWTALAVVDKARLWFRKDDMKDVVQATYRLNKEMKISVDKICNHLGSWTGAQRDIQCDIEKVQVKLATVAQDTHDLLRDDTWTKGIMEKQLQISRDQLVILKRLEAERT